MLYKPIDCLKLILQAYQAGVYYPFYQFVLVGWYGRGFWVGSQATQEYLLSTYGCTVENRETALAYGISIVQEEFASNYSKVVDSGIVRILLTTHLSNSYRAHT